MKGFDFANVYMARVEDFIPAIPLLFPSCKAASVNKSTSEVIAAETRNVTCKQFRGYRARSERDGTETVNGPVD